MHDHFKGNKIETAQNSYMMPPKESTVYSNQSKNVSSPFKIR